MANVIHHSTVPDRPFIVKRIYPSRFLVIKNEISRDRCKTRSHPYRDTAVGKFRTSIYRDSLSIHGKFHFLVFLLAREIRGNEITISFGVQLLQTLLTL